MHQCAHPHARAPWQAEQMVRDAPPGRATATAGATGAAAAAAGAEEGRPPTVQGEGWHESHLCRR